ncbi:Rne/Rng family ribonuclease [Nocardiopsis baichengensis]|uniref:Rne/Rng family ribonuclease n=1 Tax=Nocardiopsis baichengensis TaxID=280240 RepID=UPI000346AFBE|nr:Rne/Rng family ribonuclease [Nocardiopsis baichengensis]
MLENEPNGGAEGTAGTTETAATDAEVRVSAPTGRSGAVRAAGPPPEPEPEGSTAPSAPLTRPAGVVDDDAHQVVVSAPKSAGAARRVITPEDPPAPAATARRTLTAADAAGEDAVDEAQDAPDATGKQEKADKPRSRTRTRSRADKADKAEKKDVVDKADAAAESGEAGAAEEPAGGEAAEERPAKAGKKASGRRTAGRKSAPAAEPEPASGAEAGSEAAPEEPAAEASTSVAFQSPMVLFQPPVAPPAGAPAAASNGTHAPAAEEAEEAVEGEEEAEGEADDTDVDDTDVDDADASAEDRPLRRRRRRGGRGRGRSRSAEDQADDEGAEDGDSAESGSEAAEGGRDRSRQGDADDDGGSAGTRRRRRRRRRGSGDGGGEETPTKDDPPNTVVKVREPRQAGDAQNEVQAVRGSTRLEAKKQRRREGREQGRRRAPIITESEFLARRESVKRDLVIRRIEDRTQIAVLEDDVLVEHYVDRATHRSYVGNVYLGRVQNVLPSMEAAFVDIGKGRNAVLYAGEVNWDASGMEGQPKRIESVLKSGQSVLVQVTKDPLGHKGARLTSQISLPGRYLVYVPDGSMTGISRKLPDKERARLKQILKKVMPANAGVIVRTAAEGASEEELERDISRLASQWESIKRKSKSASAPSLLNSEPDLTVKVVRDVFNEDFSSLVVSSDEAWDTVREYVDYVAPHLSERVSRWEGDRDVFEAYRIDEQITKALERKVWLPSGGSLIIDRTEAMTVVDVNTGKFTGQGGNLEETVTKNNLEAAEEIVRQLRLRDIGGIIVIDFIDMVLESNRDLVLRRLLECLSRDRTKHQVAEVTSLGLVQMTRKRVGQGLLEAFSHTCEHCNGRGLMMSSEPVEGKGGSGGGGRKKKGKNGSEKGAADKNGDKAAAEDKGGKEARDAKDADKAEQEAGDASKGSAGSARSKGKAAKAAKAEEPAPEEAAAAAPAAQEPGTGGGDAQEAQDAPEEEAPKKTRRTSTRTATKSTSKSGSKSAKSTSKTGAKAEEAAEKADEPAAKTGAKTTRAKSSTRRTKKAEEAAEAAGDADAEADAPKKASAEPSGTAAAEPEEAAPDSAQAPADSAEAGEADGGAERPRRRRTRRTKAGGTPSESAVVEA